MSVKASEPSGLLKMPITAAPQGAVLLPAPLPCRCYRSVSCSLHCHSISPTAEQTAKPHVSSFKTRDPQKSRVPAASAAAASPKDAGLLQLPAVPSAPRLPMVSAGMELQHNHWGFVVPGGHKVLFFAGRLLSLPL